MYTSIEYSLSIGVDILVLVLPIPIFYEAKMYCKLCMCAYILTYICINHSLHHCNVIYNVVHLRMFRNIFIYNGSLIYMQHYSLVRVVMYQYENYNKPILLYSTKLWCLKTLVDPSIDTFWQKKFDEWWQQIILISAHWITYLCDSMAMMSIYTFSVESMICGYHKYKVSWNNPVVGEDLLVLA